MLRTPLLWASTNPFLAERLPRYRFVRRAVRRFMPGEEPEDALAEAARLNRLGAGATITLLGENVTSRTEADGVVAHYRGVLERVRRDQLDVEISVKPTQLGMDLGLGVAKANLRMLVADAAADGTMVWVDMEASPYVDRTLELFRSAQAVGTHVGVCLQAYLYRTEEDIERLIPLRPALRLVKGAYQEPAALAHPTKTHMDAAFRRLADQLLVARAAGEVGRLVLGTHDPAMIRHAAGAAQRLGLSSRRWEVAMLYGIGRREQERLLGVGHTVRVLISYGSHWFPWYMRRLAECPGNLAFVLRQLLSW